MASISDDLRHLWLLSPQEFLLGNFCPVHGYTMRLFHHEPDCTLHQNQPSNMTARSWGHCSRHHKDMTPYAYAADADIRCSCMSSRCVIALSDHPMHILPIPIRPPNAHPADLEKAPMNDLNNLILLLRCHLVITGQAQASTENIGAHVLAALPVISEAAPLADAF